MKRRLSLILFLITIMLMSACTKSESKRTTTGNIFLYGEVHGKKVILDKELEHWGEYYNEQNMRHLFVELPYYTAEFLNEWMGAEDDAILDAIYKDFKGTACHTPDVLAFYRRIKKEYPETIFHGTDVGHQFNTTGKRFLEYLEALDEKDSKRYKRAQEIIEQGQQYYQEKDALYRENKMIENFKWAFDALENESIMGIYGAYHTPVDADKSTLIMATSLKETYNEQLTSEDLTCLVNEPIEQTNIDIAGKIYKASYYGQVDLIGFKDFAYRQFWRIENAYDDFKGFDKANDYLPFTNYPMDISEGECFYIKYTKIDGSTFEAYYIADGSMSDGQPVTPQVKLP